MADTTSQAEAQAPTTAALTDADEMFIRCYLYDSVATFNTYADLHRAKGTPEADEKARRNDDMAKRGYEAFRKHMARLTSTVGASAPAPIPEHVRKAAAFQRARMDALAADPDEIAPAPTMPTRAQVSYLLELLAKEGVSNDGGDFMRRKMTDAILALITKGDTP